MLSGLSVKFLDCLDSFGVARTVSWLSGQFLRYPDSFGMDGSWKGQYSPYCKDFPDFCKKLSGQQCWHADEVFVTLLCILVWCNWTKYIVAAHLSQGTVTRGSKYFFTQEQRSQSIFLKIFWSIIISTKGALSIAPLGDFLPNPNPTTYSLRWDIISRRHY